MALENRTRSAEYGIMAGKGEEVAAMIELAFVTCLLAQPRICAPHSLLFEERGGLFRKGGPLVLPARHREGDHALVAGVPWLPHPSTPVPRCVGPFPTTRPIRRHVAGQQSPKG